MKLNDDVAVLPLPIIRDGQTAWFNPSLILDAAHGPTLVDTGLPGQTAAIASALAEVGLQITDLRRIILTHQDIDHVGSLHNLVQISGARVLAHATETPLLTEPSPPASHGPRCWPSAQRCGSSRHSSSRRWSMNHFRMACGST